MKTTIQIFTLAFLLIAGAANAQRGHGPRQGNPEQRAERMTAMMAEELNLTTQQKAEVLTINLAQAKKMKAQEQRPTPEQRELMRKEHQAALAKVLNAEQMEKLQTLHANRRGQRGQKHGRGLNREDRKAMATEIQAYRLENIHPVMLAQRAKLDPKISKKDQKAIAALQEKAQLQRQNAPQKGKNKPQQARGKKGNKGQCANQPCADQNKGKCEQPAGKPERAGKMGIGLLLEDKTNRKQAEKLVAKYGSEINQLLAEVTPKKEQWQKDMQAIREKYRPAKNAAKGPKAGKKQQFKDRAPSEFNRQLRFLLMPAERGNNAPMQLERQVNLYPNPAGSVQQLEFEVFVAGKTQVDIVDRQGKLIKTVYQGELPAGMNKVEINTSDLKRAQMYFYRITDARGATSKSFLTKE